jgi:hypothetical protein
MLQRSPALQFLGATDTKRLCALPHSDIFFFFFFFFSYFDHENGGNMFLQKVSRI